MKKYFLSALVIIGFFSLQAQPLSTEDSLQISKLKKGLLKLTGKGKVDRLNAIAREFSYSSPSSKRILDSAVLYATAAYSQAAKLGYNNGLAFAAMQIGFGKRMTPEGQKYLDEALTVSEKLNDSELLGWVQLKYAFQLLSKDKQKVRELYKSSLSNFRRAKSFEGIAEVGLWLAQEYLQAGNLEEAFVYNDEALTASQKKRRHTISWGHELVLENNLNMSELFEKIGAFETSMSYLQQARQYAIKNHLKWKMDDAIGLLYDKLGQHDSAFYYLHYNLSVQPNNNYAKLFLGENYLQTKQFEKALDLFRSGEATIGRDRFNASKLYLDFAQTYYGLGNYKQTLTYMYQTFQALSKKNRADISLPGFKLMAELQKAIGQNDSAFFYLQKYTVLKDSIVDIEKKNIWKLYNRLLLQKKLFEDQRKAVQISLLRKDILIKEQLLQQQILGQQQNKAQLALLNKNNEINEQQILLKDQELQLKEKSLNEQHFLRKQKESALALLDKDNKLKDQQLKQQIFFRNTLLAGFLLLLLFGIFFFRSLSLKRKNEKLKSEKRQAELQQQSAELEMQALRAQMNPHFIFNCLSSINKFILKNESRAASDYLTRFSRLIRRVLTNSQLSMIPLSDEIEMLKLYLDMERLRFDNSFDYNIIYANEIEPESIYVPPMLLQPFCENAIWHGLMHKEGPGQLDVVMRIENNMLNCTITDNGIGRGKAAELKSKSGQQQKSFGLKITTDRLSLFNQQKSIDSFYKTEDIINEGGNVSGTKVNLNIRYKENIHEPVNAAV